MRISDWSSDVCSSDLRDLLLPLRRGFLVEGLVMNLRLLDPVEHIIEHGQKQIDRHDLRQCLYLHFGQRIMGIGLNTKDLVDRHRRELEERFLDRRGVGSGKGGSEREKRGGRGT